MNLDKQKQGPHLTLVTQVMLGLGNDLVIYPPIYMHVRLID